MTVVRGNSLAGPSLLTLRAAQVGFAMYEQNQQGFDTKLFINVKNTELLFTRPGAPASQY